MPYQQLTLDGLAAQLGVLLDDEQERYWTRAEKYFAIWEALRVWGGITSYWRARGEFGITNSLTFADLPIPWSQATFPWNYVPAWYDLSVKLPTLRPRTWTLNQMVQDIQFMCLEAAEGISGNGMSGQISVDSILQSVRRARNQFVIDSRFPFSLNYIAAVPPPPQGMIEFSQTSVYVHRASWQDNYSGQWTNLWREDAWAIDKAHSEWTLKPSSPKVYSESENAPLRLQLVPMPQNEGILETVTVDSLLIDITDPKATFNVPDEWVHAIKYAALADIFSAESQNKDELRAQYAQMRYDQAVDMAKNAKSIIRLLINGVPLPLDTLAAIDSALPYWRNQAGRPQLGSAIYDMATFAPLPDIPYAVTADVVQSAPIPVQGSQFIPLGAEDIPHLIDYVTHVLTFKCGGQEFKDSFAQYDSFLSEASGRAGINRAKIRYLKPMFDTPSREQGQRPDRMEVATRA